MSTKIVKPMGGTHDIFIYDIASNSLLEKSLTMPASFNDDYGITLLNPHKLMICGGVCLTTNRLSNRSFTISLSNYEVSEVANMPLKMKGMRLVAVGLHVYCIGGCTEREAEDYKVQNTLFKYSSQHNTWIELSSLIQGCVFPGCFVIENEIWVTGGLIRDENVSRVSDLIQIYNIERNEWRQNPFPLLRPSYLHGVVQLDSGAILIFGGLREQNSNRFSYELGKSDRVELPLRISMSMIDPPVLSGGCVFAFSDEMLVFKYHVNEEQWEILDPDSS
jgi:N-acetylneuraminic acid mutarotase